MTIEIHNAELELILRQLLNSGQQAFVEDLLLKTLKASQTTAPSDGLAHAAAAAAQIRRLHVGITLNRPAGASLRDRAHTGHIIRM